MTSVQHINTKAGAEPYKALFSKVTIVPPNTSIAYISTQWACDPETGDLIKGTENDVGKQSKTVWENISATLKELGAEMKDIVHRTVCFLEFNEEIGKAAVESAIAATPDEWKKDIFASALTFRGVSHFHLPGIVYAADVVVAIPNHK